MQISRVYVNHISYFRHFKQKSTKKFKKLIYVFGLQKYIIPKAFNVGKTKHLKFKFVALFRKM